MKLFAQHGYGPDEKVLNGISEGSIEGFIFNARYENQEKITAYTENIWKRAPGAEILLDP